MRVKVYYIPHFLDSVDEAATTWVKFYHKDLLLHQGWKRLTLSERGAWIQLFLLAGACKHHGELRNGGFVYTDKMLAKELNTRLSCWLRVKKKLMSPKIKLLRSKMCNLSNNLQNSGSQNGVPTGFPGKNLPIDSADKKDREKRKKDTFPFKSSSKKTKPPQQQFYKNSTKIKALGNDYRGIKKGQVGRVVGANVHFPTGFVHQEQVRENPYQWEVMDDK